MTRKQKQAFAKHLKTLGLDGSTLVRLRREDHRYLKSRAAAQGCQIMKYLAVLVAMDRKKYELSRDGRSLSDRREACAKGRTK